jgi:archaemetzincin
VLGDHISAFFHVPVLILNPVEIPITAYIDNKAGVSADSLMAILVRKKPGSVTIIVGLTHSDIFTIKTSDHKRAAISGSVEKQTGIFGLGHVSGYASIVSDYRLASGGDVLFNYRLYKVTIHEMGHNLGLRHCSDKYCAMSLTNGIIWMLDEANGDYCAKCRQKLNKM